MQDNDELDKIFLNSFLKDFHNEQQQNHQHKIEDRKIAEEKAKKLEGISSFLQKFVDIGVVVYHKSTYERNFYSSDNKKEEFFDFILTTSSPSYYPGFSLFIEHPANIEIAVPNDESKGAFILNVSTEHPDTFLLSQKFSSTEQVCIALAKFIQKNTVRIEKNPLTEIKEIEEKVRFDGSTLKNQEIQTQEKQNKSLYKNKNQESSIEKFKKFFSSNEDNQSE